MTVLITGANGFLGYYLTASLLGQSIGVIATGRGEGRLPFTGKPHYTYAPMDVTDPYAVHDVFEQFHPDVVVHAGAISKPDECEARQWEAFVTNVEGTVTLLNNSEEHRSFFIFLSTDFVFDGEKGLYKEEDATGPVNYYGQTKLEAEEAVKEYEGEWAIVRTVLVYGPPVLARPNLLSIVKEKLERGEIYNVVGDQLRTPTFIGDLVDGILKIIRKKATGVFHISGEDALSPYEMAVRTAVFLGKDTALIREVRSSDFVNAARRPLKTGFTIDKAKNILGFAPLPFDEGLRRMFNS